MNRVISVSLWLAFLLPSLAHAAHVEGQEQNVVILVCAIDTTQTPGTVRVEAVSVNTTRAHIPMATTGKTCAQAVHELLTDGFELQASDLRRQLTFVFVREDVVTAGSGG